MPADSWGGFSMDLMAAKSIQLARWESGEWNGMCIQRTINTSIINIKNVFYSSKYISVPKYLNITDDR